MRTIAVLCAAPKSVYFQIPGVDVYTQARNALTFPGNMPVVTHAPCRAWSTHCRHQAKPEPGEKELAHFCADMLKRCGGIFEHPAHSHAFAACNLPLPGSKPNHDLWTIEVFQAWWGYPMLKKTWLCFSMIHPKHVHFPFTLHPHGRDRRTEQLMSHADRSKTTNAFASWLIQTARKVNFPPPSSHTPPEKASHIQS